MKRIEKVRAKMQQSNLTSLLITNMKNIYYLTGFSGTAGTIFITENAQYFMTDSRYIDIAREKITDFELIETRNSFELLSNLTKKENIGQIGFEDTVEYSVFAALQTLFPKFELISTTNFIAEIRQIKARGEIQIIRKACQIADKAFDEVLNFIEPGKTEIEIANFLDFKMRELGASGISFDTIIASGVRSSLPHGVASHKTIEFGDAITMDFGCFYENYASDMTRTIFLGEPDEKMSEIYHTVLAANEALIKSAQAGMTLAKYDQIPREIIENAGYGAYFTHGIGHGLGLDVHEIPYFGAKTIGKLQENMIVTDEPGIYLSNFGGVRIEDDLLITAEGCEVLTQAPKQLIVI